MVHRTTYLFALACALAIRSAPVSAEVMSVGPSFYAGPGKALRMTGALGPLQGLGLAGSMTWDLAKSEAGTKLVVTYGIGGYLAGGFDKIAPIVDTVVGEQVARLKAFVETGSPVPK